jgi:hypothetical protein
MPSGLITTTRKLRCHRASKKKSYMLGLFWVFISAAIFGVCFTAVPMALAQPAHAAVDDQGPVIGMLEILLRLR